MNNGSCCNVVTSSGMTYWGVRMKHALSGLYCSQVFVNLLSNENVLQSRDKTKAKFCTISNHNIVANHNKAFAFESLICDLGQLWVLCSFVMFLPSSGSVQVFSGLFISFMTVYNSVICWLLCPSTFSFQ